MKQNEQKRLAPFVDFLSDLVAELNTLASEGWVVLVEGPRDAIALKGLGYRGSLITISTVTRSTAQALKKATGVIIMTDMDREGRQLAARYARKLSHDGLQISLIQRKRLLVASGGVFRHVENLSRFADQLT